MTKQYTSTCVIFYMNGFIQTTGKYLFIFNTLLDYVS